MPKYIKTINSDNYGLNGTCVYELSKENVMSIADGEFDDIENFEVGQQITFEIIEMTENEFKSLPEFDGY